MGVKVFMESRLELIPFHIAGERSTATPYLFLPNSVFSASPCLITSSSSDLRSDGPFGVCIQPVHNEMISGFQALRQARAPVAGLKPAAAGSLQISGRTR
ncbi:hypothetical protein PoB_002239100 [Plakobranchus ocellatus]|uniref:Uncharacterized protein n=1 Tax=Plakobranchus ocellatus TaxID=259542 RepID=A0AAV3Z9C7_9GAST|nr:hypothetical protein PoB_002239100 [Plakobranchus ocellatus]